MTVQGTIGNDNVLLENAATESTLRQLLKSSQLSAEVLKKYAESLKLDVSKFNDEIEETTDAMEELRAEVDKGLDQKEREHEVEEKRLALARSINGTMQAMSSVLSSFMDNTTTASGLLGTFASQMEPGFFKTVVEGFRQLTIYQEQNFESYQKLTNAGITFAGALTEIRTSAAASYMTLDQFTDMYNKNSQVFMKLGGNVEQGSQNFAKLSAAMMKSDLGLQLQTMGYSYSQINQSMLDYLDITGGVNSSELKNKKVVDQLAASSANYMMELDMLARITGKSREELSDGLKKQSQDASVQSALMGMDAKEKEKHLKAMAYASATGIAGAEDYYKSLILGLPPMTEAGRNFAAMMPLAAGELVNMAKMAKDGNVENEEFRQSFFALNESLIKDSKSLNDQTKAALIQQGTAAGASVQQMQAYVNKLEQAGDSEEKRKAASDELIANMERSSKQAENMAKFNESLKQLSAAVNESFAPLINLAGQGLALLSGVITGIADLIDFVNKQAPGVAGALILAAGAVASLVTASLSAKAASGAKGALGGILGGGKGKGKGKDDDSGGGASKLDNVADGGKLKVLAAGVRSLRRALTTAAIGAGPMIAGAGAIAASIAIIGAGIAGAIVLIGAGLMAATWLMSKALPSLAEGLTSFADIDGENLTKVGIGIAALGAGLAVMGAGTAAASAGSVISGLMDGFGQLFGAKSPIEKINEYAKLGPGLHEAASGLTGFTSAMDQLIKFDYSQLSGAADSVKKLASSVNNIKVGKGIGQLASALERLSKSQGTIDSLNNFSNFGQSFEKSNQSIDGFIEKINQLSNIDPGKISSLGADLKSLGSAVKSMSAGDVAASAGSAISGLVNGVSQLFGAKNPIDRINEYVKLGPGLQEAASGLTGFTSAMDQLIKFDYSQLSGAENSIKKLASSINNIKVGKGIGQLAGAFERLSKSQGTIDSLNNFSNFGQSFEKSNQSIDGFIEKINQLSGIDPGKISSLGADLKSLGTSLASMSAGNVVSSAGSAISGLMEGAGQLFGIKSPIDRINEYVKLGPGLQEAASGLTGFTSAMQQLTGLNFDRLAQGAKALGEFGKSIPTDAAMQRVANLKDSSLVAVDIDTPMTLTRPSRPPPVTSEARAYANNLGATLSGAAGTASPNRAESKADNFVNSVPTDGQEQMISELKLFNANARELITQMKTVGDYQKRTYDVVKSNGGLWT